MTDNSPDQLEEAVETWVERVRGDPTRRGEFDPATGLRGGATETSDIRAHAAEEALDRLPRISSEEFEGRSAELVYRRLLGEGGMGEVWLAEQRPVGRNVAVKLVAERRLSETDHRREELSALLHEAWIAGTLDHPNIVPIYRVGQSEGGDPVVVMKHIEGVPWGEVIESPSRALEPVDDPETWHLEVIIQVCRAIEFAHDRGIIHRDLKPDNVMLGAFREVYVIDWGAAAALDDRSDNRRIPTISEGSTSVGTPSYISPEVLLGRESLIDERSDVYLLGGILHTVLTGEPPHSEQSMEAIVRSLVDPSERVFHGEVSDRLADICRRALEPRPGQRWESVRAFREALQEYMHHRESMALADEAHRQLRVLETRLETLEADGPSEEDRRIREDFARCRFGFEQALELSEHNESARRGLQRLLELMVERELERDGYEAAAGYLAALPEPRPELERRVEALGERMEERERELERLHELRRERDVDIGRYARSLFVLAVGGWTSLLNLAPVLWEISTGSTPPTAFVTGAFGVYALGIGGLVYHQRRALFQNEANRKMILTLFAALGADGLYRFLGIGLDAARATVPPLKAVMLGMCFVVLGISLDLRLLWLGVPFLGVAGLQVLFPGAMLELATGGVVVGTVLLARAWWPADESSDAEEV